MGHSAGGLYARVFAATYPREIVGLVLVDPAAEDFYARAQREFPRLYAYFDSLGLADVAKQPVHERAEEELWDANLAQARALDAAVWAPAIVLSSPRSDLGELGAIWTDEHRRWTLRGPRREYIRVDSVGHGIHEERPELVLDAVRRLIAGVVR